MYLKPVELIKASPSPTPNESFEQFQEILNVDVLIAVEDEDLISNALAHFLHRFSLPGSSRALGVSSQSTLHCLAQNEEALFSQRSVD